MPSLYLQLEGCVTHHAHGDADLFSKQDATIYDVVAAGDAALVCRYNGKDGDNLDALKFCSKVATNGARKHCPRLLRRLSFTACAYTCRYNSGCVSAIWKRQQWVGWRRMEIYSRLWQTYLRHQKICYASSGVSVRQIAAPRGAVVVNTTWSVPLHAANVVVLDVAIAAYIADSSEHDDDEI